MEQVAKRLTGDGWTYLGGDADAKQPLEVVVRAFEGAAQAAVGEGPDAPGDEVVDVPVGEGRRLEGRHFFARPAKGGFCLMSYRGI